MSDFNNKCLQAHNTCRVKHKVPALTLDPGLCAFAQEWAENIAKKSKVQLRNKNKYGENIHVFESTNPNGKFVAKEVVDAWYAEIKQHKFGAEPETNATGHFTQLVWKDTKKLGVGQATSSKGQVYVVCNYDPPGNCARGFVKNVPKIGG